MRVNGTQQSAVSLMRPSGYNVSGKNGEFLLNFCQETGATTVQIGLYFTDGNEVCANITR